MNELICTIHNKPRSAAMLIEFTEFPGKLRCKLEYECKIDDVVSARSMTAKSTDPAVCMLHGKRRNARVLQQVQTSFGTQSHCKADSRCKGPHAVTTFHGDRIYKRSDPVTTRPSPPIDSTKVAVVQGLPPDVTASDIRTYFTTFGSVTNVDFSKTTKIAKVSFSETSLVDVMVTMAATGSLTMGAEAVLRIEYGVDYERRERMAPALHVNNTQRPIKRDRDE